MPKRTYFLTNSILLGCWKVMMHFYVEKYFPNHLINALYGYITSFYSLHPRWQMRKLRQDGYPSCPGSPRQDVEKLASESRISEFRILILLTTNQMYKVDNLIS